MTLGDVVRYLILLLDNKDSAVKTPKDPAWHNLFYTLKHHKNAPACLQNLDFNWDGPQPRSPKLQRFLAALIQTGAVQMVSPSHDRCTVSDDLTTAWRHTYNQLRDRDRAFLEKVALPLAQRSIAMDTT